jgi:hypothetical protein
MQAGAQQLSVRYDLDNACYHLEKRYESRTVKRCEYLCNQRILSVHTDTIRPRFEKSSKLSSYLPKWWERGRNASGNCGVKKIIDDEMLPRCRRRKLVTQFRRVLFKP